MSTKSKKSLDSMTTAPVPSPKEAETFKTPLPTATKEIKVLGAFIAALIAELVKADQLS